LERHTRHEPEEEASSLVRDLDAGVRSSGESGEESNEEGSAEAQRSRWPRVSVVIPTLNEAKNLPHVFAQMPDDVYEVLVVDGYSTDDTVEVARRLYPDVRIVYQTSWGKGNALACGFAECRGDIVVMADADGSTDLREIPRFVEALRDGADFAKGSRFLPGGGSADITRLRQAGNMALVRLVNALFGTTYSDLCYGFNAFWRRCLPTIHVDCEGFEVETQMNIRVGKAGLKVTEVPSVEHSRIHGVSNLHAFRDGWRVLQTIVKERVPAQALQASRERRASSPAPQLRRRFAGRGSRIGTRRAGNLLVDDLRPRVGSTRRFGRQRHAGVVEVL
jgi:glycosyltransferase involved in cell wall biosynthesis